MGIEEEGGLGDEGKFGEFGPGKGGQMRGLYCLDFFYSKVWFRGCRFSDYSDALE